MAKLRNVIPANLIYLRRKNNLAQQELAAKINYSDNAISRWERGEVIPTVETLEIVADFYGVTVQDLLDESFSFRDQKLIPALIWKRIFIALFSISIVWGVALVSYIYIDMIKATLGENFQHPWLIFIGAIPLSALVGYYFNRMWGTKLLNLIIWSVFTWTALATIYLFLFVNGGQNLWIIFLLGVPTQVAMVLWYFIRR